MWIYRILLLIALTACTPYSPQGQVRDIIPGPQSIVLTDRAAFLVGGYVPPYQGGAEVIGNKLCFTRDYPPGCWRILVWPKD